MPTWLERRFHSLKRPGANFVVALSTAIAVESAIMSFGAKNTFAAFIAMALVEESSKFFFASYLRESIQSWNAYSLHRRIMWLSLWGLCELCFKAFGFWKDVEFTLGTFLLFSLIVLPALIFHVACIALYRRSEDPKRILPFALIHAGFNSWIVHSAPQSATPELVQFLVITTISATLFLFATDAIMRLLTKQRPKPAWTTADDRGS